ncbi:hypothetical protein CPLU01_04754 [Colletotrichum plurivorum]|uniref:Integral membrane protein n=1 Tax=Colletotrichum plurivorum TaxID=2175906 RepID=A0A8H6KP46_9PEZI|nr:hypothetical protein CPLU01_04754 [Colletotrichum plurivorum]
MAGIAGLLSALSPLVTQGIIAIQGAGGAGSTTAASASRAALTPAALPAASSTRAFVTPAVATLAAHKNSTAAEAAETPGPKAGPPPALQNQPPQVIVETNYIIYTTVKTLPPTFVTVTQTQPPPIQPPPPPPPPPEASGGPGAAPLVNPNPIAAPPPPPSSTPSTPTPKTSPQVAAASSASPPLPPLVAPPPVATTLRDTGGFPPPLLDPIMSGPAPEGGGNMPPNLNPMAQAGPPGGPPMEPPMGPPDPANGGFPGGVPNRTVDLPVTIMFMLLFMLGAYTHLTIYRRNAKRGHKFLISDIVFDFCMIRTVTCIFRITWSIVTTRGVVLVALITENGGAALLFAVNIFFAQRLVRSIHPKAGWCTAFGQLVLMLLFSVPAFIIFNASNLIISFFSVGNIDRLDTTDELLKFGSGWNMFLAAFPVIVVTGCLCVPGPEPEKFGSGSLRVKVALLYFGSFLLIAGHATRVYAIVNKEPPGTDSVIFGKAVFYTTGFMFELLVVAAYAFGRVDLRFHIPNGSSGPGDYSGDKDRGNYSVEEIERLIDNLDVPHQIMRERKGPEDMEMVFTIFFATKKDEKDAEKDGIADDTTVVGSNTYETPALPERPKRITRRQTLIDALRQPPARQETQPTSYPDMAGFYSPDYAQADGGKTPRRPQRPSLYSEFETGQGFKPNSNARAQQYWGPYVNEKEVMKNVDLR